MEDIHHVRLLYSVVPIVFNMLADKSQCMDGNMDFFEHWLFKKPYIFNTFFIMATKALQIVDINTY